ncbi:MAG: polysaccharide deacetylase family protein, partial [Butyricicoccus sp.]
AVSVSSPAVNTDGTLFVPAQAVAQAFGWGYAENDSYAVVSTKKEVETKKLEQFSEKAEELLGIPRMELLASSLIFRADSDCVVKNGEQTDLVDDEGRYYAPMVANNKFCLPAKATAIALGGKAEDMDGGSVQLTIGNDTIELTAESTAKLNDKNYKSEEGDVLIQDDITYISSSLLCEMLEYLDAGEGNVCMIGSLSFANADSQISYMTAMGETLPDRRPDIPKADHYVALTFDDGPTGGSSGLTARLLDGLKERGAHATFFMCGYRIKDFHTHMERYLAEGHELGNHTMDHPGLLTKTDYATIIEQVSSNNELIQSYCGEEASVFRPVGGAVNDDVKNAAKELGLPIINWSVDTLDWKYRDAARIKSVIVEEAKDGDIVLMHDLRDCTLEGVLGAIDALKDEGYAFVTVQELARIKGVNLEPGEVYTDLSDKTVEKIKNGTYKAAY